MIKLNAQTLKEIENRLVAEFSPEKIILFGSHAWGIPHINSDLDLLIIISDSELPPTRRATKAYRCLRGLKIPVEIIVSTRKEFERYQSVPSSLSRKILEKGKIIYSITN